MVKVAVPSLSSTVISLTVTSALSLSVIVPTPWSLLKVTLLLVRLLRSKVKFSEPSTNVSSKIGTLIVMLSPRLPTKVSVPDTAV